MSLIRSQADTTALMNALGMNVCAYACDYYKANRLLLRARGKKEEISIVCHPGNQTRRQNKQNKKKPQKLTGPWRLQSSRSILPLEFLESGF